MTTIIILTAIITYLVVGIFVFAFAQLLTGKRLEPMQTIFVWWLFLIALHFEKNREKNEEEKQC